ncbi:hypothetical protein B0A54_06609 [Friedmanniomyces endolithicus]|uniref:Acyclic terpene utilisation N-terminal domain-containing protein n=1 Tax=Friedmanniomyces endolithicus TaxID=329885 RepID=A0A4U0V059_9PEZI|nr:hypothetical protein B0A54_06609 [Friedmanniomyces endolithicus]
MAMLAANHPNDPIDVLTGDWMSEANMTARATMKMAGGGDAYEPSFIEALEPALNDIARYGIKVAVNAGASDTALLAKVVTDLVATKRLSLKVAWISGDEVLPAVQRAQKEGRSDFTNICTGKLLADWNFTPVYAQAYLGGLGIAAAFSHGADIVICGRVSDASPVIGAAYCSYVCGGNFTGFKSLEEKGAGAGPGWSNLGFPIAEISSSGQVIITKNSGSAGALTTQTCTSQLLYEIQGPYYYNSDVTALLTSISFTQLAPNRVALHGVGADLPPPTTKIGLTAPGGYQAEVHWYPCGLDIGAKIRMLETQIRVLLQPHIQNFTLLQFQLLGLPAENPQTQNEATVDLRIVAQAPRAEDLSPGKFLRPCLDVIMQAFPGATPGLDLRLGFPRAVQEYYVTLLPHADIQHRVHLWDGSGLDIAPPRRTKVWPARQPSTPQSSVVARGEGVQGFGPTVHGPLGWIVHARSGDKGSNCNVGFWVRRGGDEWEWLRSLLSMEGVKELLGGEYKAGAKIVSEHLSLYTSPSLRVLFSGTPVLHSGTVLCVLVTLTAKTRRLVAWFAESELNRTGPTTILTQ